MAQYERAQVDVNVNGKDANKQLSALEKQAEKYRKELEQANRSGDLEGYKKAKKNLEQVNKETKQLKKQTFSVNKVVNNLSSATYNDLRKSARQLNREMNNLNRNTKEYTQKKKQLEAIRGEMSKHRKTVRGVSNIWEQLGPMLTLGGAVMGIKRLGRFQQQLQRVREEVGKITGLTGEALDTTTAKAQSIVQTYNVDMQKALEAGNNLAQSMKISHEEAFDIMQEGFVAGSNASDEYLDMLREYPALMKEVGLNAEQMNSLINQQVKQGVFSDKGIDAIKEANIRLREMPKATEEALNQIGLSSQEIQKQLERGEKSMFDVIQMVSEKLSELPPQSKEVGQAIADIFAGPGEDAGLEYIKTLKDVDTEMNNLIDETNEYQKRQQALMESNERLNQSFNDVFGDADGMFSNIKVAFNNMIASFLQGFKTIEQIKRETFDEELREQIRADQKDIEKYGKSFVDSLKETVKWNEKRVETGIMNIRQLEWEKELYGEAKSEAKEYSQAGLEETKEQLEMQKKRLAEARKYLTVKQTEQKTREQGLKQLEEERQKEKEAPEEPPLLNFSDIELKDMEETLELIDKRDKRAKEKLIQNYWEWSKKMDQLEKQRNQKARQNLEKKLQTTQQMATQMGQIIGQAAADSNMTLEEAGEQMLVILLDQLKKFVRMQIVKATVGSLASAESIATFGAAGLAKAAVLTGLIEAAFAGIKSMVLSDSGGGSGTSTRVPQRASGNLDVVGQDDGRTYRNVPYTGRFSGVGIANQGRPALINETGGELIVDSATTNNIRMKDPGVFDLIKSYQVPQRAEGTLSETGQNPDIQKSIDRMNNTQAALVNTMDKMNKRLSNLKAKVSAEEAKEDLQEWDNFENDVGY